MTSSAGTHAPSIAGLLAAQAAARPAAMALGAPGRAPLTYLELWNQVEWTVGVLHGHGIGRRSRVALVLRNGPELAVAFLATAAGSTSAPLNPAYRREEFAFYLSDLNAAALIVEADLDSPARDVARAGGIPVLELAPLVGGPAGRFELAGAEAAFACGTTLAEPGDAALLLHTSGTTSRPKLVPLTGRNLCVSAANVRDALALSPADRCLNVMPLFHIHGLVAATLASLAAGGSVVCTPGFYATDFFGWLSESEATWYTAVPTMHQAIVGRAAALGEAARRSRLRVIRSSSAALAPTLLAELERVFGVPVIEAYGMTEAAHQIASNPLPPRPRRPGSVGIPAGPEVAVMDDGGALLDPGVPGEVVIRGENVTAGYEANVDANAAAFAAGWLRTGDHGYIDRDGYLFLTGRLKEVINRGGEKVAPREVDEVLLGHPSVAQAVTFAVTHPVLGEDVAAAVVLEENASLEERELRAFAALRLAHFKVPRLILILDEIPLGATGKVQRIGLAERLGVRAAAAASAVHVAPRTATERLLAGIWAEVLEVERAGTEDDFFALGGDSMLATRVTARLADSLGLELPLLAIFETPKLADLARTIDDAMAAAASIGE